MVVQFEEDRIKLRLRLDDTYSHPLAEKLPDDHDKLASADKFRH